MDAPALRVVVLDHFLAQDIDVLREASGGSIQWRTVPYHRFRDATNRIFPERVEDGSSLTA